MPNPSASSPDLPALHGHTHRPRSQGGTDPIELPTSETKWAMATMFQTNVAKTGGAWYRATFDSIGTNDTSMFELAGITGTKADWLQINEPGYYECYFGMSIVTSGFWGANATELQPLFNESGDALISSGNDGLSEWFMSDYSRTMEQTSGDVPYRTMWGLVTINYEPANPASDMSFTNPLQLAVQTQTTQTGTKALTGQVYVKRIAGAGYSFTNL